MENHTVVPSSSARSAAYASAIDVHGPGHIGTHVPVELTSNEQTIATAKYISLVNDIGKEVSYAPGWRGVAADRVGISHSLLSQILRGRKVTRGTLEKAIVSLRLPPEYFGTAEAVHTIPATDPPAARSVGLVVDPLLVLEGFKALPSDTRRRLLVLMRAIEPNAS